MRPTVIGGMLAVLMCSTASAENLRGVALAIGQSDYATLADLPNTGRDAKGIEDLLGRLGFETDAATDRDARQLRRDIEGFADDAQGADVAVLYYAGHAVEIGGENFLLPTDADASSPDALARDLIPLSQTIEELRGKAKLVIVLLDACRNNPLPPGTTVRLTPDAEPQPVAMVGAGGRGVQVLSRLSDPAGGNLGMVVGFAAEPGKTALDGEPGGNSPYAAALLRHLSAMAGTEFGQVMRMVTQEVYLKTGGKQRPWVNESLQQLLYFGEPAPDPTGDEGDILKERRQLLLTIADLPDLDPRRRQAERIAAEGGVPLDAVYGMLKAAGGKIPEDPAKLEQFLSQKTKEIRTLLNSNRTLQYTDPVLAELTQKVKFAINEGAIETAKTLHSRIDSRLDELASVVDPTKENLQARELEMAAGYALNGRVSYIASDYPQAAQDYKKAYDRAKTWDDLLAWQYKDDQAQSLTMNGLYLGDINSLIQAVASAKEASDLALKASNRGNWSISQENLGLALEVLGDREGSDQRLLSAIDAYRRALDGRSRTSHPFDWARIQLRIGQALWALSDVSDSKQHLQEAISAVRSALEEYSIEKTPESWATAQISLGSMLHALGEETNEVEPLNEALKVFRVTRDVYKGRPDDWAVIHLNIGTVLSALAEHEGYSDQLPEALKAFDISFGVLDRTRFPLHWAQAQNNLGLALKMMAMSGGGVPAQENCIKALNAALEVRTLARLPREWQETQRNLADALFAFGSESRDTDLLQASIGAYRDLINAKVPGRRSIQQSGYQAMLGFALSQLAVLENDPELLEQAVAAYHTALQGVSPQNTPDFWDVVQNELGDNAKQLGDIWNETDRSAEAPVRWAEALAAYQAVLNQSAELRNKTAATLLAVGRANSDATQVSQAISAYRQVLGGQDSKETASTLPLAEEGLTDALWALCSLGHQVDRFETSLTACREALPRIDNANRPQLWGGVNYEIGHLLFHIGTREVEFAVFAEAASAYRAAIKTIPKDAFAEIFNKAQAGLGDTLIEMCRFEGIEENPDQLEKALAACNEALQIADNQKVQTEQSLLLGKVGSLSFTLGKRDNNISQLEHSIDAYRAALDLLDRTDQPADWAFMSFGLGNALVEAGVLSNSARVVQEGRVALTESWEGYKRMNDIKYDEYFQERLLACCRFRGHRDKVFNGTGELECDEGSSAASSSLRR